MYLVTNTHSTALVRPNPKCIVCSPKPEIVLKLDCAKVTVKALRDDILIKALNMVTPDVIVDGKGTILISSDEDETECNNDKFLKDLQIVDGCILKVDDFFQNYELTITIIHKDFGRDDAALFEVIADPSVLKPENGDFANGKQEPASNGSTETTDDGPSQPKKAKTVEVQDDDDDLELIEDDDIQMTAGSSSAADGSSSSSTTSASVIKSPPKKRKTGNDEEPVAKRQKTEDSDDDLILIEDE